MPKKVIVVGASSGIGSEIAKELLKSGAYVTLIARREDELNKLVNEIPSSKYCIIKHDVSNFKEAANYFADAVKIMEGLDEIYYCAGILEKVSIDEFSTEKDIRMLNINTLGAFAWLNPAADFFQKKNSGKIVGISSIAGDRGRTRVEFVTPVLDDVRPSNPTAIGLVPGPPPSGDKPAAIAISPS